MHGRKDIVEKGVAEIILSKIGHAKRGAVAAHRSGLGTVRDAAAAPVLPSLYEKSIREQKSSLDQVRDLLRAQRSRAKEGGK